MATLEGSFRKSSLARDALLGKPRAYTSPMLIVIPSISAREVCLSIEVISLIISHVPRRPSTQSTIWACTLVSRAWYSASISLLYERPWLSDRNFSQFVDTFCLSESTQIRESTLAVLAKRLDLGALVLSASESLIARLLGRLARDIEELVAPQASFADDSFAVISKCTKLRYLDLSQISLSISNKLLFQTLEKLQALETLYFTCSPSHDHSKESYAWPPQLKALYFAGGIDDYFLHTHLVNAPHTLCKLSIQACSQVHVSSLLIALESLGPQLTHLTIRHPMQQLSTGSLDTIPQICTVLVSLRISADYISDAMFSAVPENYPLRILTLDRSLTADTRSEISPRALYNAVEKGSLLDLRSVRFFAPLGWAPTPKTRQDAVDLLEILEENEKERPLGIDVGMVWCNLPN